MPLFSVPTTAAIFLVLSPLTLSAGPWHGTSALLFALCGLLFPASVTLLTFAANRQLGPNLTAALGNLTPLFAVAIAFLFLGETPGPLQLGGIAIIFFGIALLFRTGPLGQRLAVLALALPLGAALLRGGVQPLVKIGLTDWPNPFAAVTIGYLVSALVLLATAQVVPKDATE